MLKKITSLSPANLILSELRGPTYFPNGNKSIPKTGRFVSLSITMMNSWIYFYFTIGDSLIKWTVFPSGVGFNRAQYPHWPSSLKWCFCPVSKFTFRNTLDHLWSCVYYHFYLFFYLIRCIDVLPIFERSAMENIQSCYQKQIIFKLVEVNQFIFLLLYYESPSHKCFIIIQIT